MTIRQPAQRPELLAIVRRIFAEGHTISTHSEDHPAHFGKLSAPLVEWEIDEGILDVGAALMIPDKLRRFFAFRDWRAPTLLRVSLRLGYSLTSAPTPWRMTGITIAALA